jgi:hypothetical protein
VEYDACALFLRFGEMLTNEGQIWFIAQLASMQIAKSHTSEGFEATTQ